MVSSFIPDTSSSSSTSHRFFDHQTKVTTTTKLETATNNIINVRIVSPVGKVANITFPITTLGYDVKLESLKLFSKDLSKLPGITLSSGEDSMKMYMKHFRLIKSRIEFDFDEQMTLADANTVENGNKFYPF